MQVPLLDLKGQYRRYVRDQTRFAKPRRAALRPGRSRAQVSGGAIAVAHGRVVIRHRRTADCSDGLDIGPGDEVITSPFTFFATAGVIARLGARPLFCDIDPRTFNLDPAAVRATIARRCEQRGDRLVNRDTGGVVKALLPVHLYGQMADLDAFMSIARQYRLAVVEDAAQAIGAALADGRRAGSVGDVGCLSFFPTKNLGAFGDAGMCVTNNDALAERIRILRVAASRSTITVDRR
jgi:dTDP-4-amino-4,6-dideoxygalactose transaminase